jgi:hypothetical protein
MYRRPEKLLKALKKLLPIQTEMILSTPAASPFVVFPLHKGSEGFMSEEQYKKFYWPTLKELMTVCIESGRVPCLFLEGENTARLEILQLVFP